MNITRFLRKIISFIIVFTFILNQAAYPELLRNRYELRRAVSYQDVVPGMSAEKLQKSTSRLNKLIDQLNETEGSGDAIERFTERQVLAVCSQVSNTENDQLPIKGPKLVAVNTAVAAASVKTTETTLPLIGNQGPVDFSDIIGRYARPDNSGNPVVMPVIPLPGSTEPVLPLPDSVEPSAEVSASFNIETAEEPVTETAEPVTPSYTQTPPLSEYVPGVSETHGDNTLQEYVVSPTEDPVPVPWPGDMSKAPCPAILTHIRISNIWELQELSGGGAVVELINNIDASETWGWNGGLGFDPIDGFYGVFNGNGYSISNLYINRPLEDNIGLFGSTTIGPWETRVSNIHLENALIFGQDDVGGLVGRGLGNTIIENSTVSGIVSGRYSIGLAAGSMVGNSSITNTTTSGSVYGNSNLGGLVGWYGQYVDNDAGIHIDAAPIVSSHSTAIVYGVDGNAIGGLVGMSDEGDIQSSEASGNVIGGYDVGGLVGQNTGTITGSHATGNVTGNNTVGGLVGYNKRGTISASYASGNVAGNTTVGGLVGWNQIGTIDNSYATGTVNGMTRVGGLVGASSETDENGWGPSSILNSHATGNVKAASDYAGGLIGITWGGLTISDSSAAGNVTGINYTGGLAGLLWNTVVTRCTAQGIVAGMDCVGGLIGNARSTDIDSCNASGAVAGNNSVGGLAGNLCAEMSKSLSVTNSTATGTVNGQDNVGGLAGYLYSPGIASIADSSASGKVTGVNDVGGLIGEAITQHYGTILIENCDSSGDVSGASRVAGSVGSLERYGLYGDVSLTGVTASGDVAGSTEQIGGLVGRLWNTTISNSQSTGDVTGGDRVGGLIGDSTNSTIQFSNAQGAVSGGLWVGGLIGINDHGSSITYSQAYGDVTGDTYVGGLAGENHVSSIAFSHAFGNVTGNDYVGGLVGWNYGGTIDSSTATGLVTGATNFGGVVGSNWASGITGITDSYTPNIYNALDLQLMKYDLDGTFTVMNDVDASDTVNWNGRLGFDPIRGFYGKLDGQGNTVSGLTIERPDEDYVGLFGDTNRAPDNWTVPVIQNLNLASAAVSGRDYVGTLVGAGYGTDIRNINLSDVDVNGRNSVGGLIGLSSDKANYYLNGFGRWIEHAQTPGLVSYSSVSGNVMGTGEFIGGLVGRTANAGSTSLMLNSISYSSSSATVTGNNAVGGLLGNLNSVNLYGQGVSNCYADGYVYGNSNFGGLVGQNIQSGITGITDSYTPNIYNALDLQLMKYDLDGTFTVMNDVDASDTVNWNGEKGFEPINNFKGTFNGGGHTIDGIAINRPNDWCVGLFGYIDGATISDVGISGGSIKGSQYVGALVGYSNATGLRSSSISRSFSTASVEGIYSVGGLVGYAYRTSISDSYVNAAVRGTQDVGGLVGYNDYYSTISNSYSAGSSYGINSNNNNIGGLVGLNNHAAISNSYSVALVSGSGNYGRLVGENAYGTIRNSAELDLHNGINAIGYDDATNGPRRYLYPDMGLDVISPWIFYSPRYLPTIYTSWNFDSIWSEENGLPQLKWQTA